jgi:3D (Asp-Asp-Asp) domain-containing protein
MTGFIWGHKEISIEADGKIISVMTFSSEPAEILKSAGIEMNEKDGFKLSSEKIEDNTKITVYRAVPVNVIYRGQRKTVLSSSQTVAELLKELNLDEGMVYTEPGRDTKITADVKIQIRDISEKVVERVVAQPYETVRQPDPMLEKGSEEVVQAGENGTRVVTVKEFYHDGEKAGEEKLAERIAEPAKAQIVRVGTRDTVETSRGMARFRDARYMEATAYLPTDGGGSCITATGIRASRGVAAVDPNVIPLGTRLYVPGYGMAIAADTGGAIIGNKIDLCMEGYSEAIHFGRRTVKVYILD